MDEAQYDELKAAAIVGDVPKMIEQVTEALGPDAVAQLGAAADDATRLVRLRAEVEAMGRANDATLARLAQQRMGVQKIDIVSVRLAVLVEMLLGTIENSEQAIAYERVVQERIATLLGPAEQQAAQQMARSKLLDGINIAPSKLPRRPQG